MGRETKEIEENCKTRHKMVVVGPHISIITLNVNGLNSPIKRHRVAGWTKEQDPTICCLQETHLSPKDKHRLRVKGWRTILQANNEQKKAGAAILISDKVDFKAKQIKKDKEGQYIMIKGTLHQEDITHKYIRNQHRSTKICKATLNRTKRRHQQQYNNSRGPQHTINTNGQNIQTENQQGNNRIK
uniref:exodeoxyribonuclease III n=1 Tax=Equus caballus TaxID=9796 RepID=A0A9L0R8B2_HORSE